MFGDNMIKMFPDRETETKTELRIQRGLKKNFFTFKSIISVVSIATCFCLRDIYACPQENWLPAEVGTGPVTDVDIWRDCFQFVLCFSCLLQNTVLPVGMYIATVYDHFRTGYKKASLFWMTPEENGVEEWKTAPKFIAYHMTDLYLSKRTQTSLFCGMKNSQNKGKQWVRKWKTMNKREERLSWLGLE